jgi:hypothetical protein
MVDTTTGEGLAVDAEVKMWDALPESFGLTP